MKRWTAVARVVWMLGMTLGVMVGVDAQAKNLGFIAMLPPGEVLPPAGATITSPASGTTVVVGQAVTFQGTTSLGDTFLWTFGDGTTSTLQNLTKTYSTTGTFTVSFKASAVDARATIKSISLFVVAAPAPPSIQSFYASPSALTAGAGTTLLWSATGATSYSISGIGGVAGSSVYVYPPTTTTYTLSATNAQGSVSAQTTVTVYPAPQIYGLTAGTNPILFGGSTSISPSFSGGTGSMDQGIGAVSSGGWYGTGALTAARTYTLTVTNPLGAVATGNWTVGVQTVSVGISPTDTTKTAGSGTMQFTAPVYGASNTAVTWKCQFERWDGAMINSPIGTDGTWTISGVARDYYITATSVADPTKSAQTIVTVVPAPLITSFTAAVNPVVYGGSTMITPVFSGGTGTIDQGIGAVTSGTAYNTIALTTGKTYTLTVTNDTGVSTTQALTVNVQTASVSPGWDFGGGYLTRGVHTAVPMSASVTGAANTTVAWSADAGTFSSTTSASGMDVVWYPPATNGPFNVYAKSAADANQSVGRTYTVVSPATASIGVPTTNPRLGDSVPLTPSFSGASGAMDQGIGVVSSGASYGSGVITAPKTFILTTQNQAGTPATASVTLVPQTVAVGISPGSAIKTASSGTISFTASVSGAANLAVTWKCQYEGINHLTQEPLMIAVPIGSDGTWTISGVARDYYITATSVADPTKSAQSIVAVVAAPSISSFSATANPVAYGGSTTITPVFSGGNGTVDQSIGTVTSGVPFTTGVLTVGKTYTLTVTNPAGTSVPQSLVVGVQTVSISPGGDFGGGYLTRGVHTAVPMSASVTGAANTTVAWSADAGTFSSTTSASGVDVVWYPPATNGVYNVYARSAVDPTQVLPRTYTVVSPATAAIGAPTTTPPYGASVSLTPTFSGTSGTMDQGIGPVSSGASYGSGVITAPKTFILTTQNQAGTPATASVTLVPQTVAVGISPGSAIKTASSGTISFTASVSGAANLAVTWKCQYEGINHLTQEPLMIAVPIGSDGTWIIPAAARDYFITVTSVADPTKSAQSIVAVVAAPSISSFSATANPVAYGGSTTITPVFSGGNGTVDQSIGTVTSGVPFTTGVLTVGKTYTLTVTNPAGTSVPQSLLVGVQTVSISPGGDFGGGYLTRGVHTAVPMSASVTGAANTTVTWSADAGTFSSTTSASGVDVVWYPPATNGTFNVYAKSVADSNQSVGRTYTIVSPATASIGVPTTNPRLGDSVPLTPSFSGISGTMDQGIGTVSSGVSYDSGVITAPKTFILTTQNQAGTPATASVTLTPQTVAVGISPGSAIKTASSGTISFTASVSGAANTAVAWKCQYEGINHLTQETVMINSPMGSDGTWTIPAAARDYYITATSVTDPTKSAQTIMTVVPAPSITSFTAAVNPVVYGGSTTITPTFTGGTGSIDQGIGTVTSGTPNSTGALTAGKTYTLMVTNPAGTSVPQSLTIGVKTITLNPTAADLLIGGTQTFTATVTGLADPSVTWTASAGSISAGIFTAPATAGTVTVTATSSDGSMVATATVTVRPTLTLTPTSAVLVRGGKQTFTAMVSGAANTVTWSATGGTVSATGDFTAPTTLGACTVTATSQADPTIKASATVNVVNLPPAFSSNLPVPDLRVNVYYAGALPTATDPDGDPLTYGLSGLPPGLNYDGTQRTVAGIPTTGGSYTVTWTVTDSLGASDSKSATWTVQGFGASGDSPTPSLPVDDKVFKTPRFIESLSYANSQTGLITGVKVTRDLQTQVAKLASGRDRHTTSDYTYGYDALGQLVQANGTFTDPTVTDPTSAVAHWSDNTRYAYDAHGNRRSHTPDSLRDGIAASQTAWPYGYLNSTDNPSLTPEGNSGTAVDTNRLRTAGPWTFDYTLDGAVKTSTRAEAGQTETRAYAYEDVRFMRLPTAMVRNTADGRAVTSAISYDMSGTRVYKKDTVRQSGGPDAATQLISDRETYYLANGTEVLLEVEKRQTARATAVGSIPTEPERYTAYIFGAGSRLARLSWDAEQGVDGKPRALETPLLNGGFESGLSGWLAASGTTASVEVDATQTNNVAKLVRGNNAEDYLEQSLGVFKAGDRVVVTALSRVQVATINAARIQLVQDGNSALSGTNANATWQPLSASLTLPNPLPLGATGEVKVRLKVEGSTQLQAAFFDQVSARKAAASSLMAGLPNLWNDPGFESVLDLPGVTTSNARGQVAPPLSSDLVKVVDAGSREGLHQLKIEVGGTYTRTVTDLDPAKSYLFSVWKNLGSGWERSFQAGTRNGDGSYPGLAPMSGQIQVTLSEAGTYDQAELIEYTPGTPVPESWIPVNMLGRVDWFITDHLGSTKLLIDQNGQHRFTGDDDPYGINLRSFGDKDTHRYTGQILDEEQGVYYYGARYYLPEIGRFLSGDPKREFNSIYTYVGNHPTMSTDPTGQQEAPKFIIDSYGDTKIWSMANKQWETVARSSRSSRPVDGGMEDATGTFLNFVFLPVAAVKLGIGGLGILSEKMLERQVMKNIEGMALKGDLAIGQIENKATTMTLARGWGGESAMNYYSSSATNLFVKTDFSEAVFYSGGRGIARQAATNFANKVGASTLEMTPGGGLLDRSMLYSASSPLTRGQADTVWSILSGRFAAGASGVPNVFTYNPAADSIFFQIERPTLMSNPTVYGYIRNEISAGVK